MTLISVLMMIIGLLVGGFSGYLKGYMNKKGENRATKEDLKDIVAQVAATTKTTEEIKAQISTVTWNRQKHWEMKREVIFEAFRRATAIKDALTGAYGFYSAEKSSASVSAPSRVAKQIELSAEWNKKMNALDESVLLVFLVCSKELAIACFNYRMSASDTADGIKDGHPNVFEGLLGKFSIKLDDLRKAMRQEMGVDVTA